MKDALEIFKDRPEAARKLVEAVTAACGGCKIPIEADKMADTARTTPATGTTTSRANLGPLLAKMTKTLAESGKLGTKRSRLNDCNENPCKSAFNLSSFRAFVDSADGSPSKEKPFQERNKIPEHSKDSLSQRSGKSLLNVPERNAGNATKNSASKEGNDLFYRFNYTITSHEHQEDGFRSGAKDGSYRAQSENGVDTRVKYLSNEFGHQPNISFVPIANGTADSQRLKGYSFLWYWS